MNLDPVDRDSRGRGVSRDASNPRQKMAAAQFAKDTQQQFVPQMSFNSLVAKSHEANVNLQNMEINDQLVGSMNPFSGMPRTG